MVSENSFYSTTGRYQGIFSWILSTDHKRIGLLYLTAMFSFFFIAVVLGLLMRLELIAPGETIMSAPAYNAVFTVHGVIMIFLFIIPGIPSGLGNFFLPLQLGAREMAFPRLNLTAWWFYMSGAAVILVSLFSGGGPPDTGWTFYVPYSLKTGTNVALAVFGVFLLGISSTMTGINVVTTIHQMRAPGMTWFRMPLFSWSLYATGWVQILATPVLGLTLLLLIFEKLFNIGLFDPSRGGDPLLFEHLFWIYSHPAVYIMILPAMGVVSEIIPVFARRTIFGYKLMAYSTIAIAFVGYLVWGHHMFTSGMSDLSRMIFSFLTFIVAVPSGIKVFNWVSSMYKGSIDLKAPLLFTVAFIFLFSIGGLTGLVNGALATNIHVHGTYFIVAHFHYTMFGGTAFAFFAAIHYWFPKIFGRMPRERLAKIACIILFLGFNLLYFPMFILGWEGMPRRYSDYLPQYHFLQVISTIGSWILVAGMMIMFYNLIRSFINGDKAGSNPWGANSLEWKTSSPPPADNFKEVQIVTESPYKFR